MKQKSIILSILLLVASCNSPKKNLSEESNDSIKFSNNSVGLEDIPALKKIEVSSCVINADTLWIVSGDSFLYYPFGIHRTTNELLDIYPFMNKMQLLNNDISLDNFYFNKSSIVTLLEKNNQGSGKIEIVDAKIFDSDIVLTNGIKVGISKSEFMRYLPISLQKNEWDTINIVVLESELLGVWNYYYFSNNQLDSIRFKTDYQYDLSNIQFP